MDFGWRIADSVGFLRIFFEGKLGDGCRGGVLPPEDAGPWVLRGLQDKGDPPHPTATPRSAARRVRSGAAAPRRVPGAGLRIGGPGMCGILLHGFALSVGQGQSIPPLPLASPGPSQPGVPAAASPPSAALLWLRGQDLTPPALHF